MASPTMDENYDKFRSERSSTPDIAMRRRKYGSVMSLNPSIFNEQLRLNQAELDFATLHRQEKWTK